MEKGFDLKGMSVEQLIDSKEFREELQRQITMECKHHDEMARQAFSSGLRLQRAPIARLMDSGVFDAENIAELFKWIVVKQLTGYSAAEREYIKQVCMMAYWRVVEHFKKVEKENNQK